MQRRIFPFLMLIYHILHDLKIKCNNNTINAIYEVDMERNSRKNKKQRARRTETIEVGFEIIAKNSLFGIGAAVLSMLALSLASAGLCMISPDPAALTLPVGIVIFLLSSALGGVVSARGLCKHKGAAVIAGVLTGFALMILSGISAVAQNALSLSSTHGLSPVFEVLFRALAIPLCALCSSITLKIGTTGRKRRR